MTLRGYGDRREGLIQLRYTTEAIVWIDVALVLLNKLTLLRVECLRDRYWNHVVYSWHIDSVSSP